MGNFPVRPEKEAAVLARLEALGVTKSNTEESFVRSRGPGGQNVNKVSTAVVLKHLPTGTEVKAQKARTQALNRYYARVLLAEKLEEKRDGLQSPKAKKIARLRKQKQKRRKRAVSGVKKEGGE